MTTTQYIGPRIIPVFAPEVEWDIDNTYEHLTMVQHQGETYMTRQHVPAGIQLPDSSQSEEYNDYWVHMSNWNAQVESYRQEVLLYNGRISTLEDDLPISEFDATNTVSAAIEAALAKLPGTDFDSTNTVSAAIEAALAKLPGTDFDSTNTVKAALDDLAEMDELRAIEFDTVSDMQSSTDISNGMIVHTNGFHSKGDGGAAFYSISDTGTANGTSVLACGSLYATIIANGKITPEMYGAYGDGVHDDTAAIQKAIDDNNVVDFDGNYLVALQESNYIAIVVPSNTVLNLNNSIIQLAANERADGLNIFNIKNVNEVTINGGTIIGDRSTFSGTSGQQCYNVFVDGSTKVYLNDVISKDARGDGFYVGNGLCEKIYITDCWADNNRRQGLSITHVDGMTVKGCQFNNTNGQAPMFGIDVEADLTSQYIRNLVIEGCTCKGNQYGGINVLSLANNDSIRISSCICDGTISVNVAGTGSIAMVENCSVIPHTASNDYGTQNGINVSCAAGSKVIFDNHYIDCRNNVGSVVNFSSDRPHKNILLNNITVENGTPERIVKIFSDATENVRGNFIFGNNFSTTDADYDFNTYCANASTVFTGKGCQITDGITFSMLFDEIHLTDETQANIFVRYPNYSGIHYVYNDSSRQHTLKDATYFNLRTGTSASGFDIPSGSKAILFTGNVLGIIGVLPLF